MGGKKSEKQNRANTNRSGLRELFEDINPVRDSKIKEKLKNKQISNGVKQNKIDIILAYRLIGLPVFQKIFAN